MRLQDALNLHSEDEIVIKKTKQAMRIAEIEVSFIRPKYIVDKSEEYPMEDFIKLFTKENYKENWFINLWTAAAKMRNFNSEAEDFYRVLNDEYNRLVDIDYKKEWDKAPYKGLRPVVERTKV